MNWSTTSACGSPKPPLGGRWCSSTTISEVKGAAVLFRLHDPGGVATEIVVAYEFWTNRILLSDHSYVGLASGQGGVVHIQTFDIVGKQVKVTVELAGGRFAEVRTYRKAADKPSWEQVS